MVQEWYYVKDGRQLGPLTVDEMRQMICDGQIGMEDLVWKEGMSDWQLAVKRAEFFEQPAQAYAYAAPEPAAQMWGQGYVPPAAYSPYAAPGQMLSYQTPTSYYSGRQNYAGFWIRFGAWVLDALVLWVAHLIITAVLYAATDTSWSRVRIDPGITLLDNLLTIVIDWLYFALQESSRFQATLGKRACGLKVTDERGMPIGFGRATGRYFAKIISGIILCIGYMMAGWTQKKQALHDSMAGTVVVRG